MVGSDRRRVAAALAALGGLAAFPSPVLAHSDPGPRYAPDPSAPLVSLIALPTLFAFTGLVVGILLAKPERRFAGAGSVAGIVLWAVLQSVLR